ncbi:MAG: photosynthetic reaction center cytochrome PufC [Pseudomonadota bacterium]
MMTTTHKVIVLAAMGTLLTACERPPIETEQSGYRGTAMVDVSNPRAPEAEQGYPAALPAAPASGPKAGEVYQNVQVLGDLSVAQFTRLMTSMTAWVSPEQGCNYCHNPANLASDDVYTKVVSRRMIEMTQHINESWSDHVGGNGVNCYTCHRGNNVPEYIWFSEGMSAFGNLNFAGWRDGQNMPNAMVGYTSLPSDAYTDFLTKTEGNAPIRLASAEAFSGPELGLSIKDAEYTYGLMTSWSQSLGVNCTFCHNTRAFQNWEQSTPQRITAHHGLNMVRDLNANYLIPLGPEYPENRLGEELGDAPKAYCATCHQGVNKPLGGADAVSAYPSLGAAP